MRRDETCWRRKQVSPGIRKNSFDMVNCQKQLPKKYFTLSSSSQDCVCGRGVEINSERLGLWWLEDKKVEREEEEEEVVVVTLSQKQEFLMGYPVSFLESI